MPTQFPATFPVTSEDAGKRLDQFLAAKIPDVSRARVQQLIEQHQVLVNQSEVKPSHRLRGHETVQILGPAKLSRKTWAPAKSRARAWLRVSSVSTRATTRPPAASA